MDRKVARQIVNKQLGEDKIFPHNSNFSNINRGKKVWWVNPDPERFTRDYYLLLNTGEEIIVLFIPANTIRDFREFRLRKDNGRVDLEISCDQIDRYLQDIKSGASGFNFEPFIYRKFSIPAELQKEEISSSNGQKGFISRTASVEKNSPVQLQQGQKILKEDQTKISYQLLFEDYLKGASAITLQDPYIRYPHQFKNLLEFCLMLGNLKNPKTTLTLELVTWNKNEFLLSSKKYFEEVAMSVRDLNIHLTYKFEKHHDRYIEANNGWKIILGRGLDIFQKSSGRYSIADIDQKSRKCKACEITYLKL